MITYEKLYETMKSKGISTYALEKKYNISKGQLDRLKKNESVTTFTIDRLCSILDCRVEDVMTYHKGQK